MKFLPIVIRLIKNPKNERNNIHSNKLENSYILKHYLIPLILFTCIIKITGRIISAGDYSMGNMIFVSLSYIIINLANIYISSWIINKLLPKFKTEQNFNAIFKLISLSAFPFLISNSIAGIHPSLSFINLIAIYSFVLLWIGTQSLLEIPKETQTGFILISIVIIASVALVLNFLIMSLFLSIFLNF